MSTLNDFLPQMGTQDTKKKLQLGTDIISFLENSSSNSLRDECDDLGSFIDSLVAWLHSSNFKVALNGLEILVHFVDRIEDFHPYLSTVLPATVDRLGDNKDQVRDVAQTLIQKLMNQVATPQYVFDKLPYAFSHKNGRVRQEVMVTLQKSLQQNGAQSLSLSKIVPFIVKLLGDPTAPVRDEAVNTLVEIYRHVGERVRTDLAKKHAIPPAKLQAILAKFDDVRNSGQMMPTANLTGGSSTTSSLDEGSRDDEPDRAIPLSKLAAAKRASSAPPVRRAIFAAPTKPPPTSTASAVQRKRSFRNVTSAAAGQAGAVDEETFIRSFEDVPKVQLFSARELEEHLTKCRDILSDASRDWDKRIDALKEVRALILAGAINYDELYPNLRLLEQPFQLSVKDLRSQVVREACISIAYMSQQLGHKMDHFCEFLLPSLINLIQNSAKVMATAGIVAIRFVIQYTHASRLIPIITGQLVSKSKEIRKACCEFLDQLLHTWPTHTLERHIAILQEAIRKGICDADPEARATSRKAFWGFHDHFKEQADSLLSSLDHSKQRMLQGEVSLSSSSSNNSLQNSVGRVSRSRASSTAGSTENLSRIPTLGMRPGIRSGIPILSSPRNGADNQSFYSNGFGNSSPMRSNSAIDMNAVQRARARQAYAAAARLKIGSVASLPRPARKPKESAAISAMTSPERSTRSRSRVGVSQSQPGSRSNSPSSRMSYATYQMHTTDSANRSRRKSGSTVHSTGASREASPNRSPYGAPDRRLSGSTKRTRPLLGATADRSYSTASLSGASPSPSKSPQVMAERILLQSQEAEAAMADALRVGSRRRFDVYNNESDDSETSSVCSERSYGSLGRGMNYLSWHSSLPRLWTNGLDFLGQDVAEIIHNLASQHWSDRKEGLLGLQCLLQGNRLLTQSELKRVTEIFTKMFMDPHTKVFSFFLDTLNELVITHKADLHDWLYILATRLLNKQGTDLLGSVLTKIQRSLDIVRESFPYEEQFYILVRFITDQTQTPNVKVKLATLSYLHVLSQLMETSDFRSSSETQAAFTKIIMWTTDQKSMELRKAAQATLFAFFSMNTPEFTKLLNQLPRNLQDNAFKLLQNLMKSPPSPMAQRLQTPNIVSRIRPIRLSTPDLDDTENMNPEDIYVSLRETSAEIQNYSFDGIDRSFTKERRELDRDTTSQDSGISQMSVPDGRMDVLEEKYETSSEDCSPVRGDYSASLYQTPHNNGFGRHPLTDSFAGSDITLLAEDLEMLTIGNFEDILAVISDCNKSVDDRTHAMAQVAMFSRKGTSSIWDQHFRSVLRALLDTLENADNVLRAKALNVLGEVVYYQSCHFEGFTELTVLKVLGAQKDRDKDVLRASEMCAGTLAGVLSTEQSIRVINPVILTGDYPVNLGAIKMLTRVVEQHSPEEILEFVPSVMPGLLKAYNATESMVRKSAVFCMVSLHCSVGDALKPYLTDLNGSKMKLLNVYIKRAQSQQASSSQGSSSPGSPKSVPLPKPL